MATPFLNVLSDQNNPALPVSVSTHLDALLTRPILPGTHLADPSILACSLMKRSISLGRNRVNSTKSDARKKRPFSRRVIVNPSFSDAEPSGNFVDVQQAFGVIRACWPEYWVGGKS
jgi:hypothetical protein